MKSTARLTRLFRGRAFKVMLWFTLVVAAAFSIMDYQRDWRVWLVEILRNLAMAGSIGALCFVALGLAFPGFRIPLKPKPMLAVLAILIAGGAAGGMLGWLINRTLFGFQVSLSVPGFMTSMAALTALLGVAPIVIINLFAHLKNTMLRLNEQELIAQRNLQLKTKAELEALRAKVNPHFLFNTLNSIASLIPTDPVNAENMVQKLANLFRYTLNASNRDFVSMEEELALIRAYLDIEKVRLGDKLSFTLDLDPALAGTVVPSMLLQPLVENSVIHGIGRSPRSAGVLSLTAAARDGRRRITLEDSGGGFDKKSLIKGFGLTAVSERLELAYGDDCQLTISTDGPTTLVLDLPMETKSVAEKGRTEPQVRRP